MPTYMTRLRLVTVLLLVVGCVVAPAFTAPADATTKTVTGTVDASAATAKKWNYILFKTTATGAISGTIDWPTTSANLDLFLSRKDPATGGWVRVGSATSTTVRPETLQVQSASAGDYRFEVRATTGVSSYTLTYDYVGTVQPVADKAYLTLLFSRSAITTATNCVQDDTNVARLDTVVGPELKRRGLRATGTVQTAETLETGYRCIYGKRTLSASWKDLAYLRDTFGFTFVSHSRHDNQAINLLTPEEQYAETCGSISDLKAHGHTSGDGLFAYPNNKYDTTVQTNVVSKCFAFGRRYAPGPNTRTYVTTSPYWARVGTVSGGKCNDPALPCSTTSTTQVYESPDEHIARIVGMTPGQWYNMQAYVLVTGSRPGYWDCTGDDWRAHWTAQVERYCYGDYLKIHDAIPSSVVVTDPKSVAVAWGRTNYQPVP